MNDTADKPLHSYQKGDIIDGQRITKVYAATKDYLIFKKKGRDDISFLTQDHVECNEPTFAAQYSWLVGLMGKWERSFFSRRMAYAMALSFDGKVPESVLILTQIEETLFSKRNINSRLAYVIGALFASISVLIGSVLLMFFGEPLEIYLHFDTYKWALLLILSCLGGLLSVMFSNQRFFVDLNQTHRTYFIHGLSRMVISMVSGIAMYLLLKSKVIFGFLDFDTNIYTLYCLAFLAGFSERIVPNSLLQAAGAKDTGDDAARATFSQRPPNAPSSRSAATPKV